MSEIKVNTITPRSGTTLTLGGSGDTVTLAACASQSGFGRTGTVDWCTTAKTSPFTAVSGKGYMVNTCGGAVTVTLPSSPTAGDIVSIADYKSTWGVACKAVTLGRGGSKINGVCNDTSLNTTGQSVTMVYIDGTQGWKSVQDSTSDVSGTPNYVTATGGTESTSGDYKIHKFTADGSFIVTAAGNACGSNRVSYMVVAGGGSGSPSNDGVGAGGGGAGGFREGKCSSDPYTDSPLDAGAGLAVTAQTYSITVGGGGAVGAFPATPAQGVKGSDSIFSTITSTGGGYGQGGFPAASGAPNNPAGPGGSGGGAGTCSSSASNPGPVGTGNTPPVSPPQGTNGGVGTSSGAPPYGVGGGGGGATVAGSAGTPTGPGAGGTGATTSISASPVAYAGGGGGGWAGTTTGGTGGGGGSSPSGAVAGTVNTGGGGGAGAGTHPGPGTAGGAGGSGIVILRYKYQN